MRRPARLRVSAAACLAPLLAAWCYVYARENVLTFLVRGDWPAATGALAVMLCCTVPATATVAAWEGGRHRAIAATLAAAARHPLVPAARALVPAGVVAAVGMAASCAAVLPAAAGGPLGAPVFELIGVYAVIDVGYAAVGYTLGRLVPVAISLPAALLGSFWCVGFPRAFSPMWIGDIDGGRLEDCCSTLDRLPAPRALIAPLLVAAGMVAAGAVVAMWRGRRSWSVAAATGCVALGVVLAAGAVRDADPLGDAGVARPVSAMTCAGTRPTLCLWPEQEPRRQSILASVRTASERLRLVGVSVPATVSVSPDDHRPGRLDVPLLYPDPSRADILTAVADAAVTVHEPACAAGDPHAWKAGPVIGTVQAWAHLAVGVTDTGSTWRQAVTAARQVRDRPLAVQAAWYRANTAALRGCTAGPQPVGAFTQASSGGPR